MKKITALMICFFQILAMLGCAQDTPQVPGSFYYRQAETGFFTDGGVIAPEIREIAGMETDIDRLLQEYFSGPRQNDLVSPFPRDSGVISWRREDDTLSLTMNDAFAALSGVELSIACACTARTFQELLGVSHVQFQSRDGLLGDEKALLFSSENVRLYDDSLDQSRAEYTVYYADQNRRYLIEETVLVNLAAEDDVIACLMDALMTPPSDSGLKSALPGGTELLDYTIDDGVCTVNLSGEFEHNSWARCEAQRLSLLSVVNTLTRLDQIQQVEFRVEGSLLVQYQLISISGPFEFDEHVIGPVRTGMNEFDATLYLANGTDPFLAAVPTRLRETAGITHAELVVEALLSYPSLNGFSSTIPAETTLNSLDIRNGVCHVDLSASFLSNGDHLSQSIHSIIASVCALEDVDAVRITVDGAVPDGDLRDLFSVTTPQSDWFV